jgi:hypothetical protein
LESDNAFIIAFVIFDNIFQYFLEIDGQLFTSCDQRSSDIAIVGIQEQVVAQQIN